VAHTKGATIAAVSEFVPVWIKLWQDAANPRCAGKKSSAISARLGMVIVVPIL
jgi:hypothetical protein